MDSEYLARLRALIEQSRELVSKSHHIAEQAREMAADSKAGLAKCRAECQAMRIKARVGGTIDEKPAPQF